MPHPIGFGTTNSRIKFYIANRPPIDNYPTMNELRGLAVGEIDHIVKNTSNHWRKAFNVYAKLLFDWHHGKNRKDLPTSWQEYRDEKLFRVQSQEALLFSKPELNNETQDLHIIAGKTYAATLDLPPLIWVDPYFALNKERRLIVAPYPDYRQLSNARIAQLIALMKELE